MDTLYSKKVSIVLPVYNVEKFIRKSIQSVLNQSYANFELIIVIDGSPDSSKQIAESFEDSRIRIFQKENGGLSDARNYGIDRAQGEYIYFMDSDDWIEPSLLEDNLKLLKDENLDFIVFGYIQDNENEHEMILSSKEVIPKISVLNKNATNLKLDNHTLGILGYAWNKIYRKDFILTHNIKFEKGTSLIEDILFNVQVYKLVERIIFNQKAYYHYINRPIKTLIKTFHSNSFELKRRKVEVLKDMFLFWKVVNSKNILAESLIQGIRYCLANLYGYKNNLTETEKKAYIHKMYSDPLTIELIKHFQPNSVIARLFKILVNNKMVILTSLLYLRKTK